MNIFENVSRQFDAKAEAAGFDTSRVWYHGSSRRFAKFRKPGNKGINELGVGVYLCSDWNYANTWAQTGGFIHHCYIRRGDIFDHSAKLTDEIRHRLHDGHSRMMIDKYGPEGAYDYEDFNRSILKMENTISGWRLPSKFLIWAGYIGAMDPYSQITSQIVIFEPKNVLIFGVSPGGGWGDGPYPLL